jgi:hypothetical protein
MKCRYENVNTAVTTDSRLGLAWADQLVVVDNGRKKQHFSKIPHNLQLFSYRDQLELIE